MNPCPVCATPAERAHLDRTWLCQNRHTFQIVHTDDPKKWSGPCPDTGCKKPLVQEGNVWVCATHGVDWGPSMGVWPVRMHWWPTNDHDRAKFNGEQSRTASFSSMSLLGECAKRYKFKYVERLPDPSGRAALIGTHVHRVLELGGPRERDMSDEDWEALMRAVFPEIAAEPDFPVCLFTAERDPWTGEMSAPGREMWLDEVRPRLMRLVNYLREWGQRVLHVEKRFETVIGGVPIRGFVDRVEQVRHHAPLRVIDWKSGRPPNPKYKAQALVKTYQPALYAEAMEEQLGITVEDAVLVYAHPELEVKHYDPKLVRSDAIAWLQKSWVDLEQAHTANHWPANTGPLCGWCPYVGQCEEGQRFLTMLADKWVAKDGKAGWKDTPAYLTYSAMAVRDQPPGLREALAA